MVTGPNGSGKSSLFRILGELWPVHCGRVVKPPKCDILFIPQKPYLVMGTLRDQIIYPHTHDQMKQRGVSDDDLRHLLEMVDPARIILTQWKFDEERDWFHSFSGGQKQRVAMARLFYHRPRFAILDECTSAVSDDVEHSIYETCKILGTVHVFLRPAWPRVLRSLQDDITRVWRRGRRLWRFVLHVLC